MSAIDTVAGHHSITVHTPLADVVVGCACTPGVQRDEAGWAAHLLEVLADPSTSGAVASAGQEPAGDAGSCHVIPINRNT